jgi:hypothetical protein
MTVLVEEAGFQEKEWKQARRLEAKNLDKVTYHYNPLITAGHTANPRFKGK